MIVRKYTNYMHHVYRKTHPENISMSSATRANPLLKFSSILSGRQLFARDKQADVAAAAKQLDSDKGAQATNEVASYQTALKLLWDGLGLEEQAEWDEKAEDECGDIEKYGFRHSSLPMPMLNDRQEPEGIRREYSPGIARPMPKRYCGRGRDDALLRISGATNW